MKKTKKIIVFVLIFILVILVGIGIFFAIKNIPSSNENTISREAKIQKGTFEYMLNSGEYSVQDTYFYSDDYFKKSGEELDPHLRTMSICLALTSINAADKDDNAENVKNLLSDIGFCDIQIDDINSESSKDTIGSAIAHKKIGDKELIAVSIRGGYYRKEWASNMLAGKTGDIEGFSNAAKTVISRIKVYKEKNNIKDYKMWITGYSRGGAVSNLIGKYINESLRDFDIKKDDLYVYTFEAPLASSDNTIYKNIHNVVNKNDVITYVFPKKWGLYNNGVEEVIDIGDQESYSELLEEFVDWLTKSSRFLDYSITREKYVQYLEEPFINITEIIMNKTNFEKREIFEFFKTAYELLVEEENMEELKEAFPNLAKGNFDFNIDKIIDVFNKYIEKVYENSNVPLSEEEINTLKESIKPIANVLTPILITSVFDGDEKININGFEIPSFHHLYTFVKIFPEVLKSHFFELNIELLKNMDSYYLNEK